MNDDRLRELYQAAEAARAEASRASCPAPEALLALVERRGPEAERLATLDHVMACADCRREFDLLRAVHEAGAEDEAGRERREVRSWRRALPAALLAASIIIAVGIGVEHRREASAGGGVEQVRGGAEGVALVAPAAGSSVEATPRFVWRAVPGAARYHLEIVDADGAVVLTADATDTTYTPPRPGVLLPGRQYSWWVSAIDAGGAQRRSAMRELRVRE